MSNSIVSYDVRSLIEQWLKSEYSGEQFPVPFHDFWNIAGHGKRQDAFSLLESLLDEGSDFLRSTVKNGKRGRPSYAYWVTCDGLKHFCLASKTEEGRHNRQYFIEAEKKWRLVEKTNPELAQQIELQKLINEGKLLETQANQSQLALYQFRHNVVSLCPEVVQQKVLGYQTVKEIEYRDRVIKDDDVINDGSTITKNELCRRYKLFTANGKPDYRLLNRFLEESRLADNKEAWQLSATIQEYSQLKREYVPVLDKYFNHSAQRDLFLGE